MIVRIDTTNLTRGREFTLYANNPNGDTVAMYGLDILSGTVTTIPYTHSLFGKFDGYTGVAPQLDGYLMATVGTQKVVKKIGSPLPAFCIGYKPNYTVAYTAYDANGTVLDTGNLHNVVGDFYYTTLPIDTAIVHCLNKDFIVNKNLLKMNYEITMGSSVLNSTYGNITMDNVPIPSVTLPMQSLGSVTLDAVMPNVTIKEL
jgi:hypothetical protein